MVGGVKSILLVGALMALGAGGVAFASDGKTIAKFAGRFSKHFKNGNIDGDVYFSDDVVEVVPVDRNHAYVRISLQFFNGHACSIRGVATVRGTELVYRGTKASYTEGCEMRLRRNGKFLELDDGEGSCQMTCGARGGYGGEHELLWASRRPIRYMKRLKQSSDYRDALAEWWAQGNASRR